MLACASPTDTPAISGGSRPRRLGPLLADGFGQRWIMRRHTIVAAVLFVLFGVGAQAHAGLFDAFKSKDRLRQESMARGLSYHQASEAARLIQYSYSRGSGGMTSMQREALKNGASWHQARQVR
jgi:hypothetical protein